MGGFEASGIAAQGSDDDGDDGDGVMTGVVAKVTVTT